MSSFAIVESPYAGDRTTHHEYLRRIIRWCFTNNYIPYASHGLYPHYLEDDKPNERLMGIQAGIDTGIVLLHQSTTKILVFTDYGISAGMQGALVQYTSLGFGNRFEMISIGRNEQSHEELIEAVGRAIHDAEPADANNSDS